MKVFPGKRLGAWREGDEWIFRCWAPKAQELELLIAGPVDQLVPPGRDDWGYWEIRLANLEEGRRYGYRLGKADQLYPDPASRHQPVGVHGPSALVDLPTPDFSRWKGRPLAEMLIYELHVGAFSPEGTFDGIIDRLDYLVDLGINTLEIMPLAHFPGERNWGYDGVCPFAVADSYGGPRGLSRLIEACHQREIAVLIDVVYNHLGPEGNYLPLFGPFFTEKHHTPWGPSINMDDTGADGVRNYFMQNALMWLRDFGADGLRLDAVHAIKDDSAQHFLEQLAKAVDDLAEATGRTLVLVAEVDLNAPRYVLPRDQGGYGLTGQWVDEFHHALHAYLTGERDGYYADFGELQHLRRALRNGYVYTGQYSPHRGRNFGRPVDYLSTGQFVVFLQNHDQIGNRALGDRLSNALNVEQHLLAAGTYLLSPYVPLIFMGEEYRERAPFQYFVSHGDPELVEAVRKGRAAEFAYFQKQGLEVPDPQAEDTFRRSKLRWQPEDAVLTFYRRCLALRRELNTRSTFSFDDVEVDEPVPGVLSWTFPLGGGENPVFIYANFTDRRQRIDQPPAPADTLLESQPVQWEESALVLPPWGFAVLEAGGF